MDDLRQIDNSHANTISKFLALIIGVPLAAAIFGKIPLGFVLFVEAFLSAMLAILALEWSRWRKTHYPKELREKKN